jgi:methylmalonyl-CoA mutase N-terminal domain/subunit
METKEQQVLSASGIPVKEVYTPEDVKDVDYHRDIGFPGEPPFTRGVYPSMYRGQLWTIRRLSGFNTPKETNELFRQEYELGQTGFSVAPDFAAMCGLDPDHPRVRADIGHSGAPICSLEDMEETFEGLPIEKVSTYLADGCGTPLTAMYFVMAQKRGLDIRQLRGTTPSDLCTPSALNIYNQIPPRAQLRYAVDFIEWCSENAPKWYPTSINSYNPRENGISAIQELGMLFAAAIQLIEEEKRRGRVPLDRFVRRFSFQMAVHNDFFEEIAKLRAARRMWYRIIAERYGIKDPHCAHFRCHVQTSGSTHTYQEPYNNIIRIAYQVLAGALGGAQSIHANGYDEAICLPTEQSMLLSIRTEQILQYETGITKTTDPLGGSWFVESLTNELEKRAWEYIQKIEDMGGWVAALESGWVHREYQDAMIEYERKLASGEITVVGVNKFRLDKVPYEVPIFRPDPKSSEYMAQRVKRLREKRDNAKVKEALQKLEEVTRSGENTFPATMEAVRAYATVGELCQIRNKVYGVWRYPMGF